MIHQTLSRSFAPVLCCAAAIAQGPDFLLTYSQPETTLSNSGGTVLQDLAPNEVNLLQFSGGPCSAVSAEKWAPRTCYHVMAGDEDANGMYWNPAIFGTVDALLAGLPTSPVGGTNQRDTFFSPAQAMGTAISGAPGLRPGDVGRIVRNTSGDGQVEHFITQEQLNQALGLPPNFPIDVDAIAWAPGMGVYFSLDQDVLAVTQCGPMLIEDGAIVCLPDTDLTFTTDNRVATVVANCSFLLFDETTMDGFVLTAQVTDRFGACVTSAGDVEALEIDWNQPAFAIPGCTGTVIFVPAFLFATETMTGASLLTTAGGGQIHNSVCWSMGTACGNGPTFGPQAGIQPVGGFGAPSHINAITSTFTCRYVLEPEQHAPNVFPFGAPQGFMDIDVASPFALNLAFIEIVPPTVPNSLPAFPFSLLCFPDVYIPNLSFWWIPPMSGGFGSFPMIGIPAGWSGKILFQSVGIGGTGFELSTPCVIDI